MSEERPREVGSASELLAFIELTGIKAYKIQGDRIEINSDSEGEGGSETEVMVRASETLIESRLKITVYGDDSIISADFGVEYELSEKVHLTADVLNEFLEKVGVMAAFPFVRESIFTTATRLGVDAPVLGLIRAGEFKVTPTEAESEPHDFIAIETLAANLGVAANTVRKRLRELYPDHPKNTKWNVTREMANALRA